MQSFQIWVIRYRFLIFRSGYLVILLLSSLNSNNHYAPILNYGSSRKYIIYTYIYALLLARQITSPPEWACRAYGWGSGTTPEEALQALTTILRNACKSQSGRQRLPDRTTTMPEPAANLPENIQEAPSASHNFYISDPSNHVDPK